MSPDEWEQTGMLCNENGLCWAQTRQDYGTRFRPGANVSKNNRAGKVILAGRATSKVMTRQVEEPLSRRAQQGIRQFYQSISPFGKGENPPSLIFI